MKLNGTTAALALILAVGVGFAAGRFTAGTGNESRDAAERVPYQGTARRHDCRMAGVALRRDPSKADDARRKEDGTLEDDAMGILASTGEDVASTGEDIASTGDVAVAAAEMKAAAARRHAEWQELSAARIEFLADLDDEGMGDTAKARLGRIAEATAALDEAETRLAQDDLAPEERAELEAFARSQDKALSKLVKKTRRDLLRRIAFRLGCPKEQVDAVASTIHDVYKITGYRRLRK